ncbi:MAG: GNAT family N-acetyltransferase [Dehalococcoidia bacterium]
MIELVPVRREEIENLATMILDYWRELDEERDDPKQGDRDMDDAKRLLYEAISRGDGVFWITREDREIGFVEYSIARHWLRPEVMVGEITEIYVRPDERRGGSGREAVERILGEMKTRGVAYATLATSVRNDTARRFSGGLGFQEDRIEMKRTLEPGS